jgi:hypothetical protein
MPKILTALAPELVDHNPAQASRDATRRHTPGILEEVSLMKLASPNIAFLTNQELSPWPTLVRVFM